MRKTDDTLILKMLDFGKTQKEIALHFSVSPAAICKRLKQLAPLPKSLDTLTEKERLFAIGVSKGKNQTQAALDSFEVSSRESAKVIGSQLMRRPEVKQAVADLMDQHGLTRSYRVQRLKNHVDHADPNVSLKALDQSWKLDGSYAPEKHLNVGVTYESLLTDLDNINAEIIRLTKTLGPDAIKKEKLLLKKELAIFEDEDATEND